MLKILLESIIIELNEQGHNVENGVVVDSFINETFKNIEKSNFLTNFEKEVMNDNITKGELKKMYFNCVCQLRKDNEI